MTSEGLWGQDCVGLGDRVSFRLCTEGRLKWDLEDCMQRPRGGTGDVFTSVRPMPPAWECELGGFLTVKGRSNLA